MTNNQPHIIIFYDKVANDRSRFLIKQFEKNGFEPKVDAVHVTDYSWFEKNCKSSYSLFLIRDKKVFQFFVEDLTQEMLFHPDFAIFYNVDVERPTDDWLLIKNYLMHIFEYQEDAAVADQVKDILQPATKIIGTKKFHVSSHEGDPHYHFKTYHLPQKDVMLYEVIKPNTEIPYTSVTREYSVKGHLPFFTDLFICDSWGVARADFSFLKKIWKYLEMNDEFDIDALLKTATDRCFPSDENVPQAEPEVYRRCMEEIIEKVSDDFGCCSNIPDHILNQ